MMAGLTGEERSALGLHGYTITDLRSELAAGSIIVTIDSMG